MSQQKQVKDWITVNGQHIPIFEGESKSDAVNRAIAKSNEDKKNADIKRNKEESDRLNKREKKSNKLEDRLKGDDLLNAKDTIEELKANDAVIDDDGYVTVYHRTNEKSYNDILKTGVMRAKEDGIFFSTKKDGSQAEGFGDKVIQLKIPVEKFVIDDEFGDEAHLRIPLKNRNATLNISDYLKRK